eukprot:CFRG7889T1
MAKKKISENPKSVEARERKNNMKEQSKAREEKLKEDASWKDDDKNLAKKNQKKEAEERKKAEAAAKRNEMKALLEADEAAVAIKTKTTAQPKQKVTQHQLRTKKAIADEEARLAAIERDRANGIVTQDHLESFENTNRADQEERDAGNIVTSGLDAAVEALNLNPKAQQKKTKTIREEFEAERLPELRSENPGLKKSQYQQLVWKEWLKSPRNPSNQKGFK